MRSALDSLQVPAEALGVVGGLLGGLRLGRPGPGRAAAGSSVRSACAVALTCSPACCRALIDLLAHAHLRLLGTFLDLLLRFLGLLLHLLLGVVGRRAGWALGSHGYSSFGFEDGLVKN